MIEYIKSDRPLLTPPDAAKLLKCAISTLDRWRQEGSGPVYIKLAPGKGGKVLYPVVELNIWLNSNAARREKASVDERGGDDGLA